MEASSGINGLKNTLCWVKKNESDGGRSWGESEYDQNIFYEIMENTIKGKSKMPDDTYLIIHIKTSKIFWWQEYQ